MSCAVYKLNGNFTKKISEVSELLKNSINEGINAQLVSEMFRTAGSAEIILLNFEFQKRKICRTYSYADRDRGVADCRYYRLWRKRGAS